MTQRLEFVKLAQEAGEGRFSELCRRFGISRKCGYKWTHRFRSGGEAALADRSRRPHRQRTRTPEDTERLVLDERTLHPGNGPRKLHRRLQNKGHTRLPSPSTFARILKRNSRIDPRQSQRHTPFKRFQREHPNQLWQMDFKGHFPLSTGQRCHPLTVIDDHSRYLIALKACPNENALTVQTHLTAAFKRYGLPQQILCDNGSPWGCPESEHTALTVWLLQLGIQVLHGRIRHPQTQGKDERFHRTLKDELLLHNTWPDFAKAQSRFDTYRHDYNHHRPHQHHNLETPDRHYRPSLHRFPNQLPKPSYPPEAPTRTVRNQGLISYGNRSYYIGRAFAGHPLCLRPHENDNLLKVCFGSLTLGLIDLNAPAPQPKRRSIPLIPLKHKP